ncbi:hypothetical protein B0H13DRAFT_1917492 [Mycena leptocephala]|nr:hypothetical protein B0H13DRAFT_1917492 [Mycena leptocephala]
MPLFTSASGFQITGGTFIDNAADIHIHTMQPVPGPNTSAVEFVAEDSSHERLGIERNDQGIGAARMLSDDASQTLSRAQNSSPLVADGESSSSPIPSFLNPTQIPFSPQEPEFSSESHELFHDSLDPAFEQPLSNFVPMSAIPEVGNNISPSDNMFSDVSIAQAVQPTNNCPPPSRIFQGRQSIHDEMDHFFKQQIRKQHIYERHKIALKFINGSSRFTGKFFLDARSTVTIETGRKNIATVKNVDSSSQDALKWLANTNQHWLLFYDNADDPKINPNRFLPRCNNGNIIITSRNPKLCVYAGAHSAVSDMDETDAVALLLKSAAQINLPANEEIAAEIVKAGVFISQSEALNGYLDIYMKSRAQLLSKKPAQSHDEYTWTFLEPAGEWDTLRFLKVTNGIKAYSLMSFDPERKMFAIHPLVHRWSRTTISDQQSYHSTMASIMGMSIAEIPTAPTEHQELPSLRLISHVESLRYDNKQVVVDFAGQYGIVYFCAGQYETAMELVLAVLEQRKRVLGADHPDTLQAMDALAVIYLSLGHSHKAAELAVVVLEKAKELGILVLGKQKQVLGDDHPDTLRTMGTLAKELGVLVLGKRKQVLGDDHLNTLRTMGNLAQTYHKLREFHKAEKVGIVVLGKQNGFLVMIIQTPCGLCEIWHQHTAVWTNCLRLRSLRSLFMTMGKHWRVLLIDKVDPIHPRRTSRGQM